MNSKFINLASLFDAEAYRRSGSHPWTFFAYPTSIAVEHGLPPDCEACRMLGGVQAQGIDVAIWISPRGNNTTYFACRRENIERLNVVLTNLEETESLGADFCARRSDELFLLLENSE